MEEMCLHGSQPRLDKKISMGTAFLYHLEVRKPRRFIPIIAQVAAEVLSLCALIEVMKRITVSVLPEFMARIYCN